ncbi:MAG TPA: ABC transporter permease, partial [Flavobacteriales bacterium]|nr:ABC transporter permease [Flavobacteriales bacterium]
MYLETIGKYALMLKEVFKRPQKPKIFWENYFKEVEDLGIKSIGLVSFISFFIGGVVTIQTARNLNNPLIDKMYIGYATIKSIVLEFSPTFVSIILAGIVGSYIASTIGTMRITEQIDALDVMGVNSANYLILPKLVAALSFYPFLIVISMFLGVFGGWVVGNMTGMVLSNDYLKGIRYSFDSFDIFYALIKTLVFAFFIATVPAYYGYHVKGGSLEVGRAATQAVIWTSINIIIANYILTQL